MQLTLKTLKGAKFSVTAEETSTIAEVKAIIEKEKSELPAASMKLIHSGKVLKDDQTVADCNIKPNAFLVVMISKAKKKAAVAAPAATPAAAAPATPAAAPAQDTTATPGAAAAAPAATTTSTSETPAPAASETTSAPAPAAAAAPPADDLPAEAVASLIAMGFPEAEVRACLRAAQGNADVAVEFLMSGIPDYAQAAASGAGAANTPATPAAGASSSSAEPLAQLRNHPQINDLRRLVQGNPSTLQAVLTQIGQQQPELLQEINGNQELFLQIMNEPVSESSGSGSGSGGSPGVSSVSSPAANATGSAASGPGGLSAEMMAGMGNPAQMAQMIDTMSPEQLQGMAQMMGLTPEQLRMTATAISRMPPEELQNYMQMAMQAEGMGGAGGIEGMMGGAGGGPGPGGAPPGAQVLRLTEEEMAAVDRLCGMGFDRSEAAQAYIACDKNEELAANLLMDGGFGFGDDVGMGGGGAGGGGNDDDMYD